MHHYGDATPAALDELLDMYEAVHNVTPPCTPLPGGHTHTAAPRFRRAHGARKAQRPHRATPPLARSLRQGHCVAAWSPFEARSGLLFVVVMQATNLPILHGEFSFTALDSGLPNLKGARHCNTASGRGDPYVVGQNVSWRDWRQTGCKPGQPFTLQRERAAAAEAMARRMASVPYLVGYHWWRFVDETPGGRWPVQPSPLLRVQRLSVFAAHSFKASDVTTHGSRYRCA